MTDDQVAHVVQAVNTAIRDSGLCPDDAVVVLAGIYAEAATRAGGAAEAAHQTYVLALRLAKDAGLDAASDPASSSKLSH